MLLAREDTIHLFLNFAKAVGIVNLGVLRHPLPPSQLNKHVDLDGFMIYIVLGERFIYITK